MNEIYWLTRLGALSTALNWVTGVSLVVGVVMGIIYLVNHYEDEDYCDHVKFVRNCKKITLCSWVLFFLSIIGNAFVPNTKEAYLIYGVGGVVDWVKQDDVAKQLPHKAVVALDKWFEEITLEESSSKQKEE